jgi:hypothetical protein
MGSEIGQTDRMDKVIPDLTTDISPFALMFIMENLLELNYFWKN